MTEYQSKDLQQLFGVVGETIRSWANEFEEYLSPGAVPQSGRKRRFSYEDARVLALVADIKNNGGTYDDAHIALKSGERGELPTTPETAIELQASLEVETIRHRMMQLQSKYEDVVKEKRGLEEEVIKLKTRLEEMQARVEAETRVTEMEKRLDLERKVIELQIKLDMLQKQQDKGE